MSLPEYLREHAWCLCARFLTRPPPILVRHLRLSPPNVVPARPQHTLLILFASVVQVVAAERQPRETVDLEERNVVGMHRPRALRSADREPVERSTGGCPELGYVQEWMQFGSEVAARGENGEGDRGEAWARDQSCWT